MQALIQALEANNSLTRELLLQQEAIREGRIPWVSEKDAALSKVCV